MKKYKGLSNEFLEEQLLELEKDIIEINERLINLLLERKRLFEILKGREK